MSVTNLASSGHSIKKSSIWISVPASIVTTLTRFLSASLIVKITVTAIIAAMYKKAPIFAIVLCILILKNT